MKNKKGFSAVIVLLSILVVSVIGFAGYYVWNTQQDKKEKEVATVAGAQEQAPTAKEESQSTPVAQDTQKYLEIKEWGVKMALAGYGYRLGRDSSGDEYASLFSDKSKELVVNVGGCEDYTVGSIVKLKEKPIDGTPGSVAMLDNTYYLLRFRSQAACVSDSGELSPAALELNKQMDVDSRTVQNAWASFSPI